MTDLVLNSCSGDCLYDVNELMENWQLLYIDGLVQERHNSSALAIELRLSCTNPSIWLITLGRNSWDILHVCLASTRRY